MEELTARFYDAALDIKNVIDELDDIRRDQSAVRAHQLGLTILKLRGAFSDLQGLIPTPHSLPPQHQSE